jgi:hypothetical protein
MKSCGIKRTNVFFFEKMEITALDQKIFEIMKLSIYKNAINVFNEKNPDIYELMYLLQVEDYICDLLNISCLRYYSFYNQKVVNLIPGKSVDTIIDIHQQFYNCLNLRIKKTNQYIGMNKKEQSTIYTQCDITQGSVIKYIKGITLEISDETENELIKDDCNFSCMEITSKKRKKTVLLGPMRLVNHSCNPNTEYRHVYPNIIELVAIKNIKQNEELFVGYAKEECFYKESCLCGCVYDSETETCKNRSRKTKEITRKRIHDMYEMYPVPTKKNKFI